MRATVALYGIKDRSCQEYPCFVHDHNLCVMKDGKIIQYLQLERLTRRKHDNRLDVFIEDLIDEGVVGLPDEFDLICVNDFVGSAFISKNGRLHFESDRPKQLIPSLIPANAYLSDKTGWGGREIQSWACPHELAHVFTAIPFSEGLRENSLLVSLDGASSFGNYSAFLFRDEKLTLLENGWKDLGYVSKFFNDNKLAFKILGISPKEHCSLPGKLMGFASWGVWCQDIEEWLRDNEYFNCCGKYHGAEILDSIKQRFGNVCKDFDTLNPFLQNCAATLQHIFAKAILDKLERLQNKFHCDYLYYGGGCALNIVTNSKIVELGLFKEIFIAPCCDDSGLSIGAATFLEMQKGNNVALHSPYLCDVGLDRTNYQADDAEVAKTAELLMRHKIVGICNGVSEAGPRALGNRSLVALPDSKELSRHISMGIKKREWYRPLAPIMLLDNARKTAEQDVVSISKYMLMDFRIKPNFREQMAGVVHANGTARIQTISCEEENPFMFRLLSYLYDRYGTIALINTSFNQQGEPIVHTHGQAMEATRRMKLDGVVINGVLNEGDVKNGLA